MAGLTTHALNTMAGQPAAHLRIDLSVREGAQWRLLKTVHTNAQGRTDTPLLTAAEMTCAEYELLFHVGAYFIAQGAVGGDRLFLDQVPIRFGIASAEEHYHVPLLVTPWSYATYRGS
jgi:5-hydroxyisourate hydrolase